MIGSFITEPLEPKERAEISYALCDFFSPGNYKKYSEEFFQNRSAEYPNAKV